MEFTAFTVAIVTAHAKTIVFRVNLSAPEQAAAEHVLRGLFQLGHLVSFSVAAEARSMGWAGLQAWLRNRFDAHVVDAVTGASLVDEPQPAYLLPVWSFDHVIAGNPASTARFLSADLEVCATPCQDSERGAQLRGWSGSWDIWARPL
jgi:hypothetical protein